MKSLKTRNVYGIRRMQGGLLALFTLLVLLLFNASAWWIYLKVGGYLEEMFSRSLRDSAKISAITLREHPDMLLPARSENSLEYIERQTLMIHLQKAGHFNDLFLIDADYRNLVGVFPDFQIGQVDGLLLLDRDYLDRTRSGEIAMTPAEQIGDLFLKTAYVPVLGPDQAVQGILVAKADVEFLRPKLAIRNTLVVVTALNALIILLLAMTYWRFQKALHQAEARIVHSERLASLGQMAAGIAHELRNPLNIIEQTMTLLRRRYDDKQDPLFDYIPDEVSRMNSIITQFLDLSREAPVDLKQDNLAGVLERTLSLLEHQIKKRGIHLEKQFPESMPAQVDAPKMQQVFLNLCLNAIEALPEQGGFLKIAVDVKGSSGLWCVVVEDNGPGMNPDEVQRIFEPFYTAKASGTGLGLWVVDQLVGRHGGHIEVDSSPGRGTRMKVFIPRLE